MAVFMGLVTIALVGTVCADEPEKDGPRFSNARLEAEDLAEFLGIEVWAFSYEGPATRCWLEVTEVGQKTVNQTKILEVNTSGGGHDAWPGRVVLFMRPGDLQLRVKSEASSGGASVTLPGNALWWGWKSSHGKSMRLQRPVTLEPGKAVTLLHYEKEESGSITEQGTPHRKVKLEIKVETVKDER
jgi:hypothetical protein